MKNLCLIALIMIVGCASPKQSIQTLRPQVQMVQNARVAHPSLSKSVAAPAAPVMIGPVWDAPPTWDPAYVFEVWSTDDLAKPFTLARTTTELHSFAPMKQQEYFMVRTRDTETGAVSGWAESPK